MRGSCLHNNGQWVLVVRKLVQNVVNVIHRKKMYWLVMLQEFDWTRPELKNSLSSRADWLFAKMAGSIHPQTKLHSFLQWSWCGQIDRSITVAVTVLPEENPNQLCLKHSEASIILNSCGNELKTTQDEKGFDGKIKDKKHYSPFYP